MHSPWKLRFSIFCFALQVACFASVHVAGQGDYPWESVLHLDAADGPTFKAAVQPMVEMVANSYRYPKVVPIKGWTLLDAVDPAQGGMHAILYQDDADKRRIVVSFKGTDLTSKADICADDVIWQDKRVTSVSDFTTECNQFSNETLDYVKQSIDYTAKVIEVHPDASILLTGHSLGAGLAVLAAIGQSKSPLLPVVSFSAPGTRQVIQRNNLQLSAEQEKRIFTISDEWDEIMRASWASQVGTTCMYSTTKPQNCTLCFSSWTDGSTRQTQGQSFKSSSTPEREQKEALENVSSNDNPFNLTPECWGCFQETHFLSHIIRLYKVGVKPVCESHLPQNYPTASS